MTAREKILRLIADKGISLKSIMSWTGLPETTVREYLDGQRPVTLKFCVEMAEGLGVGVEQVMDDYDTDTEIQITGRNPAEADDEHLAEGDDADDEDVDGFLGHAVKDTITGVRGVATAVCRHLLKDAEVLITGIDTTGRPIEFWTSMSRVEVIDKEELRRRNSGRGKE